MVRSVLYDVSLPSDYGNLSHSDIQLLRRFGRDGPSLALRFILR
jgi:hypothetical protein